MQPLLLIHLLVEVGHREVRGGRGKEWRRLLAVLMLLLMFLVLGMSCLLLLLLELYSLLLLLCRRQRGQLLLGCLQIDRRRIRCSRRAAQHRGNILEGGRLALQLVGQRDQAVAPVGLKLLLLLKVHCTARRRCCDGAQASGRRLQQRELLQLGEWGCALLLLLLMTKCRRQRLLLLILLLLAGKLLANGCCSCRVSRRLVLLLLLLLLDLLNLLLESGEGRTPGGWDRVGVEGGRDLGIGQLLDGCRCWVQWTGSGGQLLGKAAGREWMVAAAAELR